MKPLITVLIFLALSVPASANHTRKHQRSNKAPHYHIYKENAPAPERPFQPTDIIVMPLQTFLSILPRW